MVIKINLAFNIEYLDLFSTRPFHKMFHYFSNVLFTVMDSSGACTFIKTIVRFLVSANLQFKVLLLKSEFASRVWVNWFTSRVHNSHLTPIKHTSTGKQRKFV